MARIEGWRRAVRGDCAPLHVERCQLQDDVVRRNGQECPLRLAISLRKTCSVSKGLAVGHMRITAKTAACSIACHASAERDLDRCSRRSKARCTCRSASMQQVPLQQRVEQPTWPPTRSTPAVPRSRLNRSNSLNTTVALPFELECLRTRGIRARMFYICHYSGSFEILMNT